MPTLYTLIDGTQVRLPDGLSDAEAEYRILKTLPEKQAIFGRAPDIEKVYNIRDGLPDLGARFNIALARGNPEEIKATLNDEVGEGNWGMTEEGNLYVTPAGYRAKGAEPPDERPVFVDGTSNGYYDLGDIGPEIIRGIGAVGGEAAALAVVGGPIGILARIGIGALGAAGGDAAANIGLEGIQTLRGANRESPLEIVERAGTESVAVLGASLALGLPIAAAGRFVGKSKDVANKYAKQKITETGERLALTPKEARQESRDRIVKQLQDEGFENAEDIVPVITIRDMIGDQNTVTSKMLTVLEGIGARYMGDAIPAKSLDFMKTISGIYDAKLAKGLSPGVAAKEVVEGLSKSKQKQLKNMEDSILNLYKRHGAEIDTTMRVDDLRDLITGNINKAFKTGMEKFKGPTLYGTAENPNPKLNIASLATQRVKSDTVANTINRIAKNLGNIDAEDAVQKLGSLSNNSEAVGRMVAVVDFKNGKAVPKPTNKIQETPTSANSVLEAQALAFMAGKKAPKKEVLKQVNARDLYDVQQGLRRSLGGNLDRSAFREATIMSGDVLDSLDLSVGLQFGKELKRVNNEYRKFVAPYNSPAIKFLYGVSGRNVGEYATTILRSGKYKSSFTNVVEELDAILKDVPDVATADEILGTVATQYIRRLKNEVGLDNLANKPLPVIQKEAKAALNTLKKLEVDMQTPEFKKAYKRFFDTDVYEKYKAAITKLSEGNIAGRDELGELLSYSEAKQLVLDIANTAENIGKVNLPEIAAKVRRHGNIDADGAEFYRDLLFGEIISRAVSIGGLEGGEQMAKLRTWAGGILDAKQNYPEAFDYVFKNKAESLVDYADIIRGSSNLDRTAGSIAAATIPLTVLQNAMKLSAIGVAKPVGTMIFMKSYGPGGKGWIDLTSRLRLKQSPEKVESAIKPGVEKAFKSAQKAATAAISGRNGLLAASVAAYLNEQGDYNVIEPGVKPKFVRYGEQAPQQQQAPAPDLAMQQQELGANIMNMLQSASRLPPMGNIGQSGLKEGAAIARAR
jgi:hypothetical protein